MKNYQRAIVVALMAVGLAACSSTGMNYGHQGTTADNAAASADRTNGSNGGGADNSMGSNAGTGNSGVSPGGR